MAKFRLKFEMVPENNASPEPKSNAAKALSRQLRITALTLLFTMGMIVAVTVAWFSSNKEVESNDMKVNVQTSPNLIIATADTSVLSDAAFKQLSSDSTAVSFASNGLSTMVPVTHPSTWAGTYGLKYSSDAGEISDTTGLTKAGSDVSLAVVSDNTDPVYFVDYVCRIASADQPLDLAPDAGDTPHLYASFTEDISHNILIKAHNPAYDTDNTQPETIEQTLAAYIAAAPTGKQRNYAYASSVDFFFHGTSSSAVCDSSSYKGTLNLAKKDITSLNHATAKSQLDLLDGESITTIPCNSAASNNCYYVTMRIYFDGALLEDATHTYVRSASLNTQQFALGIHFSAETESP